MTGRVLVTLQLLLLALLGVLPWLPWPAGYDAPLLRVAGYVLVVVGGVLVLVAATHLGDALTANPVPKGGAGLRTGGLYRHVRHPIYSGVLLLGWGLALRSERWSGVLLAVLLTGLLGVKARYEEHLLTERHPDYPAYAARTPRFLPHVLPRPTFLRKGPLTRFFRGSGTQ